MTREFKTIMDRALVGTKYNHPDWDLGANMTEALQMYINGTLDNNANVRNSFYNKFSREHNLYNVVLRKNVYNYSKDQNTDAVLCFLDLLFQYCQSVIKNPNLPNDVKLMVADYYIAYINITRSLDSSLESNQQLYKTNRVSELGNLIPYVGNIVNLYANSLNPQKVFEFESIKNLEVSKSATSVLTNNNDLGMKESFVGTLLSGKISVASLRGFINNPRKPQQDSVLSIAKSNECFLNVVADGAGGSIDGAKASKAITDAFNNWFNSLNEEYLNSLDIAQLASLVEEQLKNINNYVMQNYYGSYSTVVIALTVNGQTLIANVGDSTAYAYNDTDDQLIELTTLDSASKGMSYEEARHNPDNNKITQAIGLRPDFYVNYNVVINNNDRIILSSDGVTDLVSEENFKNFFRNKDDAKSITMKAVYNTDVDAGIRKIADNSSAIVIDLPPAKELGTRRY